MFSVLLDIKSVQFLYKSRDTDVQVVMRKKKKLVFSLEKVMLLSLVAKHQGSQMVEKLCKIKSTFGHTLVYFKHQ